MPRSTDDSAIPDDYRTRHPITLSEAQHSLDIPVSPADNRLPGAMAENVKGFVQNYVASSTSIVQMQVPTGSANAASASIIKRQIRSILTSSGIPAGKIAEGSLWCFALRRCGAHTAFLCRRHRHDGPVRPVARRLEQHTSSNKNWYNFGCASQNNLRHRLPIPWILSAPAA
ncbi:CpaD family pilus assembly lipoprotein [Agrobacterium cavarae]|uniref:CpaD family pilus assembly lipoprotein n=1 Tax=Agrobacterium cavarae TaxID=2528239 RepID=UPI003AB96024